MSLPEAPVMELALSDFVGTAYETTAPIHPSVERILQTNEVVFREGYRRFARLNQAVPVSAVSAAADAYLAKATFTDKFPQVMLGAWEAHLAKPDTQYDPSTLSALQRAIQTLVVEDKPTFLKAEAVTSPFVSERFDRFTPYGKQLAVLLIAVERRLLTMGSLDAYSTTTMPSMDAQLEVPRPTPPKDLVSRMIEDSNQTVFRETYRHLFIAQANQKDNWSPAQLEQIDATASALQPDLQKITDDHLKGAAFHDEVVQKAIGVWVERFDTWPEKYTTPTLMKLRDTLKDEVLGSVQKGIDPIRDFPILTPDKKKAFALDRAVNTVLEYRGMQAWAKDLVESKGPDLAPYGNELKPLRRYAEALFSDPAHPEKAAQVLEQAQVDNEKIHGDLSGRQNHDYGSREKNQEFARRYAMSEKAYAILNRKPENRLLSIAKMFSETQPPLKLNAAQRELMLRVLVEVESLDFDPSQKGPKVILLDNRNFINDSSAWHTIRDDRAEATKKGLLPKDGDMQYVAFMTLLARARQNASSPQVISVDWSARPEQAEKVGR